MPLIANILRSLAKSVLILLELTASATDAAINKKMFGSGKTTLIVSNKEMTDIMKIVKLLKKSSLLMKKALVKQLKMELKNKKEDFLGCYYAIQVQVFEKIY